MRGGAGLLCETVGVCCASCVKVMNVCQWTDGDSWAVTQGTTGGLRSWHWTQGRDRRESPVALAQDGCPWLEAAPVPGWGAGVGTQALVILVSHLAKHQYVLLLFSAAESVCEGKQCHNAGDGKAEALREAMLCHFSLHSRLHVLFIQISDSWLWPQRILQTDREKNRMISALAELPPR